MSVLEVVLHQEYYNQQTVNRWNYLSSGSPASVTLSFALLSAMGFIPTTTTLLDDTIGGELQTLQNTGVLFVQAIAKAVYVDEDFFDNPFYANTRGATGASAGDLAPVDAFGFRSSRVKQSIGRGYKRFVGVADEVIGAGGALIGGAVAQADLLAAKMGETLTYDDSGNTLTFTPCICQKKEYITPRGKKAYEYWPTEAEQIAHSAGGIAWEAYKTTRTQTSRQYGRGI